MDKKYSQKIKKNLTEIADILNKYNLLEDTTQLYASSNSFSNTNKINANLHFKRVTSSKVKQPCGFKYSKVDLFFKCEYDDISSIRNLYKPYDQGGFDCEIIIKADVNPDKILRPMAGWHFDFHRFSENNEPKSNALHPLFHFHFGGHRLKAHLVTCMNNKILLTESPRLLHPPMDIFLVIDFILGNFYGEQRITLIKDIDYRKIIIQSHIMLWQKYFQDISNYFTTYNENAPSFIPNFC